MSDNLKKKLLKVLEQAWKVTLSDQVDTTSGKYIQHAIWVLKDELGGNK